MFTPPCSSPAPLSGCPPSQAPDPALEEAVCGGDGSIQPYRGCAKPPTQMPGGFIRSNPKLETTQTPTNRCADKQTRVHPSSGTLVSNKKEWTTAATWVSLKIIVLRENGARLKKSTHCMGSLIANSRKCKRIYTDRKQSRGCLGRGSGWQGQEEGLHEAGGNFWRDRNVYSLAGGCECQERSDPTR